ncbi:uncharacterized protein METZ01_LOCUS409437, partial [marine metagenome]
VLYLFDAGFRQSFAQANSVFHELLKRAIGI